MSADRRNPAAPGLHPVIAQLVQARKDQNLSQEELAEAIGTSQSAVSCWESGKRRPSFASAARWAEVLGFRPFTLVRHEEASQS
jgi:transcriptional regulator with XRE-family HTH domain